MIIFQNIYLIVRLHGVSTFPLKQKVLEWQSQYDVFVQREFMFSQWMCFLWVLWNCLSAYPKLSLVYASTVQHPHS